MILMRESTTESAAHHPVRGAAHHHRGAGKEVGNTERCSASAGGEAGREMPKSLSLRSLRGCESWSIESKG